MILMFLPAIVVSVPFLLSYMASFMAWYRLEEKKLTTLVYPILNLYPIFGGFLSIPVPKSFQNEYIFFIVLDALRVMSRIKKSPSQAEKMKMNHFSNIGVIEIFLESVPSAFILILISIVGFSEVRDSHNYGLCNVLIGRARFYSSENLFSLSFILFWVTCATSIFSAGFGMAR